MYNLTIGFFVMAEIYLKAEDYKAYREVQEFFIHNDALPTARTLARCMGGIPVKDAIALLQNLQNKNLIARNTQKGYMWVRTRPVVYEI